MRSLPARSGRLFSFFEGGGVGGPKHSMRRKLAEPTRPPFDPFRDRRAEASRLRRPASVDTCAPQASTRKQCISPQAEQLDPARDRQPAAAPWRRAASRCCSSQAPPLGCGLNHRTHTVASFDGASHRRAAASPGEGPQLERVRPFASCRPHPCTRQTPPPSRAAAAFHPPHTKKKRPPRRKGAAASEARSARSKLRYTSFRSALMASIFSSSACSVSSYRSTEASGIFTPK